MTDDVPPEIKKKCCYLHRAMPNIVAFQKNLMQVLNFSQAVMQDLKEISGLTE